MSALTITPSEVVVLSGTPSQKKVGAVAITAGQVCTPIDGVMVAIELTTADEAGSKGVFLAVANGAPGQFIGFAAKNAVVNLGTGLSGKFYWAGSAGIIHEYTDLVSDDLITFLGYFRADEEFVFIPTATGIALT